MTQRTAGVPLVKHVALGAGLWGGGSLVYGAVEALTNTGAGLYQPVGIWAVFWGLYGIGGLLGGGVVGFLLFLWNQLPPTPKIAPAPFLVAAFLGSLLCACLAVPINDRLPMLLSPVSIAVNGVILTGCAGVMLLIHRHLRARAGKRLILSAVNLSFFFSLCLTLGQYVDTFVAATLPGRRAALLYTALLVGGAVVYVLADRIGHLLLTRTPRRLGPAAVSVLILLAIGLGLKSRGMEAPAAGTRAGIDKPNILWIVMDTTRADHLSAYGYPRRTTPHVDALATEGILFENAIAQSSWTIPSHFEMVTSRYAAGKRNVLDGDFVTAAEMLKAHGYETGAILANFALGRRSGFEQGFDTVVDGPVIVFCLTVFEKIPVIKFLLKLNLPPAAVIGLLDRKEFLEGRGARADAINVHATRWLQRQGSRPFFLFINYMDPHDPYDPPPPFRERFAAGVDPEVGFIRYSRKVGRSISAGRFVRDVLPKMSAEDLAKILALYDGEMAYLDDQIGRLLSTLKAQGLYDRTIVVITADHGELFGEHGLANHMKSLSDEELHVPLIMRYPAALPAGRRVSTLVELSDILPTLLEMGGIAPETRLDGRSLMPLVREAAAEGDGWGEAFSFLIRKPDRNYPHTAAGHLIGMRTTTFKYVWSSTGQHAYYDLVKDPRADHNLYGDLPEVAAAARRLDDWRKKAGLERIDADERIDRLTTERLRALGYVQ